MHELLAAGQDLDDAERGDRAALLRAHVGVRRSTAQLRKAISELHPYVLDHAGLEAALHSLIEGRRRAQVRWTLDVGPKVAGVVDRLVLSVATELIANAARHSGGGEIAVSAGLSAGELVLEVADDGRGMDPEQASTAVAWGHPGARHVRGVAPRRPTGGSSCSTAPAAARSRASGCPRISSTAHQRPGRWRHDLLVRSLR